MATNYKRGRAFEYRVRKWYESLGCFVVRSAGSKGPVDLVVFFPNGKTWAFIQCKLGAISKSERNGLRELAEKFHAVGVVAQRGKRGELEFVRA